MDSSVLLSLVGVALVLSVIFLTGLCLNCKGNSQPKYITQQYQQSSHSTQGFGVVRQYTENNFTTLPTPPSLTNMASPLVDGHRRLSGCPSFDCESQIDYVNQEDNCEGPENGYEVPPDKNQDYPDYLDVLPDDPHQSQPSLASSANSGQNYENVNEEAEVRNDEEDPDSDSQEYINVAAGNIGLHFHTPIVGSYESRSSDGQDSLDYVNAEAVGMIHMG